MSQNDVLIYGAAATGQFYSPLEWTRTKGT